MRETACPLWSALPAKQVPQWQRALSRAQTEGTNLFEPRLGQAGRQPSVWPSGPPGTSRRQRQAPVCAGTAAECPPAGAGLQPDQPPPSGRTARQPRRRLGWPWPSSPERTGPAVARSQQLAGPSSWTAPRAARHGRQLQPPRRRVRPAAGPAGWPPPGGRWPGPAPLQPRRQVRAAAWLRAGPALTSGLA